MLYSELVNYLYKTLSTANYPNSRRSAYQLANYLANEAPETKMLFNDRLVNVEWTQVNILVQKLVEEHYPLAYLINAHYFYDSWFYVNNDVLIPRDDTEGLIDLVLRDYSSSDTKIIFDLGTGSGILGISLALKLPLSQVYASDISISALTVAKTNQEKLKVNNIKFLQGDWLDPFIKSNLLADIIISNPPYIVLGDPRVAVNVHQFEPHQALYAPHSGNWFYEQLLINCHKICQPNAKLYLEIGEQQVSTLIPRLKSEFKIHHFQVVKDLQQHNRYLIIKL